MSNKSFSLFYIISGVFATCFVIMGIFAKTPLAHQLNASVATFATTLHHHFYTKLAIASHHLGHWYGYVILLFILFCVPFTRKHFAYPLATALVTSALLNKFFKTLFSIERPLGIPLIVETGYGFPSGHTMSSFIFYGLAIYLCVQFLTPSLGKSLLIALLAFLPLFISINRIYLGVHNTTDILGAVFLAGSVLCLFLAFLQKRNYLNH